MQIANLHGKAILENIHDYMHEYSGIGDDNTQKRKRGYARCNRDFVQHCIATRDRFGGGDGDSLQCSRLCSERYTELLHLLTNALSFMASIRGPSLLFNMIMQVGNDRITAVRVAYGDAQMKPVDAAGVPTGDAVVGQMAIENLVRGFLNPINPLSPPTLLPNDRFCIHIGGQIPPLFADQLLDLIQTVAEHTRHIEIPRGWTDAIGAIRWVDISFRDNGWMHWDEVGGY